MKALGLSSVVFAIVTLAAPQAEAHFRPVFRSPPRTGLAHHSALPDLHRHGGGQGGYGGGQGGFGWDATPDYSQAAAPAAPDAAPQSAGPQFVPVPVFVPVGPRGWAQGKPSEPRLILIGSQTPPQGPLPTVVYGDPLPGEKRGP